VSARRMHIFSSWQTAHLPFIGKQTENLRGVRGAGVYRCPVTGID
jgi:hypothetical protein